MKNFQFFLKNEYIPDPDAGDALIKTDLQKSDAAVVQSAKLRLNSNKKMYIIQVFEQRSMWNDASHAVLWVEELDYFHMELKYL